MLLLLRLIAWCGLILVVFGSATSSADQIKLSIYAGVEQDFCPGGYGNVPRCAPFSGFKFDELSSRGRLKLLFSKYLTLRPLRLAEQTLYVPVGAALSRARRSRDAPEMEISRRPAVLLVIEWLDGRSDEQSSSSSSSGFSFAGAGLSDEIVTGSVSARRSFNHGSFRGLDPEERYSWDFVRANQKISIIFR